MHWRYILVLLALEMCYFPSIFHHFSNTFRHWFHQILTDFLYLFVSEPHIHHRADHVVFRRKLCHLSFADCPQVFNRVYVGRVSWPWQHRYLIVLKKFLHCTWSVARGKILLKNASTSYLLIKRNLFQHSHNFCRNWRQNHSILEGSSTFARWAAKRKVSQPAKTGRHL